MEQLSKLTTYLYVFCQFSALQICNVQAAQTYFLHHPAHNGINESCKIRNQSIHSYIYIYIYTHHKLINKLNFLHPSNYYCNQRILVIFYSRENFRRKSKPGVKFKN